MYGLDSETLFKGGLHIYTTLDLRLQKEAEQIVSRSIPADSGLQVALVAIDPKTGYIQAMVGGRDYEESQFNRVLAKRQPGSSFKPVLYLTALSEGYTALNEFRSAPTIFAYDGGTYAPSNFGDNYANREIQMREAISRSDNIYAVNTIMDIGPDKVIDMARKLGIAADLQAVPSLALGASPVSPLEMASAYSTFANQGTRMKPIAILKVENSQGEVLVSENPQATQVVSPAQAYVLTHMLQSVLDPGGTAYRIADILKRPAAAKTGTTSVDAWISGYLPDLTATVRVGYDRDRKISPVEAHLAAPIWAEFMESARRFRPAASFPIPDGVTFAYIDPTTGLLANKNCPSVRLEAFVTGTEPTQVCTVHLPDKEAPPPEEDSSSSWWDSFTDWWSD